MAFSTIHIIKNNLKYKFTFTDLTVLNIGITTINDGKVFRKTKIGFVYNLNLYIKANKNIIHNKKMLKILLAKYLEKY